MNSKPKLILIGGFLGSGKTSLMMSIGERLARNGSTVAVVTNDQGEYLVDTAYARSRGMTAGEVLGGCFCCNFGELTNILQDLSAERKPDYILAEPVGSCTDLAATVISPLLLYYQDLVEVGPYLVLADGARMVDEYSDLDLENPISPRETLISHQLRESGLLVLSKSDLLSGSESLNAVKRLQGLVPRATIVPCSARTGEGIESLIARIEDSAPQTSPKAVELDYDLYAEAEAELGWYNGIAALKSANPFSPEDLAVDIITGLKDTLGKDAAHAKLLLGTDAGSIKASLAGGRLQADSALKPGTVVRRADLTLNIRALRSPEDLEKLARYRINEVILEYGLSESDYRSESLIPAAPRPTYRIS